MFYGRNCSVSREKTHGGKNKNWTLRTGKTACGESNLGSNCSNPNKRLENDSGLDEGYGWRDRKCEWV